MKKSKDHPYPRVGVCVFIMKQGKFLLGLRQGSHGAGSWGLPGGKLDLGETWENCAEREAAEEVGVRIKDIRFVTATNDLFEDNNLHYVTIFMRADWLSGEPRVLEPQKCKEWRWFSYDAMPDNPMLPLLKLQQNDPNLNLA